MIINSFNIIFFTEKPIVIRKIRVLTNKKIQLQKLDLYFVIGMFLRHVHITYFGYSITSLIKLYINKTITVITFGI